MSVPHLDTGNLQLALFVVVRLVKYNPIAHVQRENIYQSNILMLIFQTAKIVFQSLKALYMT